MSNFKVFYSAETFGRRRVKKYPKRRAHSFVKQFIQLLYCDLSLLTFAVNDITSAARTVNPSYLSPLTGNVLSISHCGLATTDPISSDRQSATQNISPLLADGMGIVFGTNNTAVTVNDAALGAIIANGSGAGQFTYYGCWGLNFTVGASTASFDIERIVRNDSGGTITVAETGIYAYGKTTSAQYSFCIMRDVLGATIPVLNTEYLKFVYTIQVSI